ncbi:MAG TPA: glycosyltransferase, partial [Polyangiaceae bacterium]|nr:glycosyltransferase [Polyangiaceae bacterium]
RWADRKAPESFEVRYLIDSLSPLTWRRAALEIERVAPDLVVAPVWTFFLAPCLAAMLAYLRWRGIRVASVVHNAADHDMGRWRAALISCQLRQADIHVTHTPALAAAIRKAVPTARVQVCTHPVFCYPKAHGTLPRRAELELLMFGLLRPYKGLDVLLQALALLEQRSAMLSVVGENWQDMHAIRAQVARLRLENRVEFVPRYVSDEETAEYFSRADAVVLPYRSVTGSGVLPLAFHFGKPVVVSRLSGLFELVEEGRTGWIVPPGDPIALAKTLEHEVSQSVAFEMRPHIERAQVPWTFEHFAEVLLQAAELPRRLGEQPAPKGSTGPVLSRATGGPKGTRRSK